MIRLVPLAVLLVACGPAEDTQSGFADIKKPSGSQPGTCDVVESVPLAVDEQVGDPMFFSAADALGELTGVTNTTNILTYPNEDTMGLEVEFVYTDGAINYVTRENNGVLTPDQISKCFDAIEIEGVFTFVSNDGVFNETFTGVLQATKRREGRFVVEHAQSAIGGTWTPETSGIDPVEHPDLTLEWDGQITNLGSEGVIRAYSGDYELDVASWNPPPTQG